MTGPDAPLARPHVLAVAGTGTDVGKTVCTASLLRALRVAGFAAQALKPVQTGVAPEEALTGAQADAPVYAAAVANLDATGQSDGALPPAAVLTCLPLPASPHLAAAQAGIRLDVAGVARAIRAHQDALAGRADVVVLECAGGLMVPLNEGETTLDLLATLDIPVLLVGRNELGALNHVLLSLEALRQRDLPLAGLCLTPGSTGEAAVLADNVAFLRTHLAAAPNAAAVPVLELPRLSSRQASRQRSGMSSPITASDWQRGATALAPLVEHLRTTYFAPQGQGRNTPEALIARDHRVVWHPYASALALPPLAVARRSHHNRIVLENGQELVDGMSSWWAAIHGYNHPHLMDALRRQAGRMPHVMFGGLTHRPAIRLAEHLLARMPQGLERVFFADSGSVAVEVALKMALQYQMGRGERQRTRFLTPRGGYHGDTFGAMSVCDPETGMHSLFTGTLAQQCFVPRPSCRFDADFDPASLHPIREMLTTRGQEIAAVILEPVVQGAGGMWFYHPDYLRGLRQLCDEAGVLLIFDEIATGFGRTGKYFAAEWAGVAPDILCCGKALTGGVMTLAATACTAHVASNICQGGLPFMHGPTFMANPLACAVANASLDILDENRWQAQVAQLEAALRVGLEPCRNLPGVADVRVLGGIGVVETREPVNTEALHPFFVQRNVWVRPFGRLVYLMPPYITPTDDVRTLCKAVVEALA